MSPEKTPIHNPNAAEHYHDPINPPRVKLYPLGITLGELAEIHKIPSSVLDQVMFSMQILRDEKDLPFEVGDIVFYPGTIKLYEVVRVIENSGKNTQLECRDENYGILDLNSSDVFHLGHLIDANATYIMPIIKPIDLEAEGVEGVGEYILQVLKSLDDQNS